MIGLLQPLASDGLLLAKSIQEGTLLACCDGSYSPTTKQNSQGWVLANQTITFWHGAGPVDGHKDLVSAYRAELCGFVAILQTLTSICTFHQFTNGTIIVYGDCLSAINKLHKIVDYLVANFNLLNEGSILLEKLKTITSTITFNMAKKIKKGASQ